MSATEAAMVSTIDAERYEPFLVEGEPVGEVHWLRPPAGDDGPFTAGIFRVEAGEFPDGIPVPYEFHVNETIHVLEGSVLVEMDDGRSLDLGVGDVASFTKGAKSVWTFRAPFRKFFVEC